MTANEPENEPYGSLGILLYSLGLVKALHSPSSHVPNPKVVSQLYGFKKRGENFEQEPTSLGFFHSYV